MRILDIGCGNGALLFRLAGLGFTRLCGIDPYLPHPIEMVDRVRILAAETTSLRSELFEFIMLHHSLEHMLDQRHAMNEIKRLLAPRGTCLIRIPVAGSDPWRRYGADWAELDAPRHVCLHTQRSLTILAEKAGLAVMHTEFDGDAFAYWASELYRRGLSYFDHGSNSYNGPGNYFTQKEVDGFKDLARQANNAGTSGRAAFFLRHRMHFAAT
jgi:SAM-dependent methyltransferase